MKARDWLATQSSPYQWYFSSRNGDREIAASGVKHLWEMGSLDENKTWAHIRAFLRASPDHLVWGGVRFDMTRATAQEWKQFPQIFFVAPEHVRVQQMPALLIKPSSYKGIEEKAPPQERFLNVFQKAIGNIGKEGGKIVLAHREVVHDCVSTPWEVLERLCGLPQNSYRFLMRMGSEDVFVGASPERLFAREQACLYTEALAGTCNKGQVFSDKEYDEHRYVQTHVETSLRPLCLELNKQETLSLALPTLQHLYTPYVGILKAHVDEQQLLQTLHPTPAVCGTPQAMARRFIAEHEGFDRGLYAGAVGYMTAQQADFAVAIRSALMTRQHVYLYAGAGIVQHSDPDAEWQEIHNKMRTMRKVLTSTTYGQA